MEIAKEVPQRYPSNEDSVGIEIVGVVVVGKGQNPAEHGVYEPVNEQQNSKREIRHTVGDHGNGRWAAFG